MVCAINIMKYNEVILIRAQKLHYLASSANDLKVEESNSLQYFYYSSLPDLPAA